MTSESATARQASVSRSIGNILRRRRSTGRTGPNLLRRTRGPWCRSIWRRVQALGRGIPRRRGPRPHSAVRTCGHQAPRCWASTRSAVAERRPARRRGSPRWRAAVLLAGGAGQQRLDLGEVVDDVVRGAPDGFVRRVHPLAVGGQPRTAVPGQPGGARARTRSTVGASADADSWDWSRRRNWACRTVRRRRFGRDRNVGVTVASMGTDFAAVAGLLGHPARAAMIGALMSGEAVTAGELAPMSRASGPRPPASTWPGWWMVAW